MERVRFVYWITMTEKRELYKDIVYKGETYKFIEVREIFVKFGNCKRYVTLYNRNKDMCEIWCLEDNKIMERIVEF